MQTRPHREFELCAIEPVPEHRVCVLLRALRPVALALADEIVHVRLERLERLVHVALAGLGSLEQLLDRATDLRIPLVRRDAEIERADVRTAQVTSGCRSLRPKTVSPCLQRETSAGVFVISRASSWRVKREPDANDPSSRPEPSWTDFFAGAIFFFATGAGASVSVSPDAGKPPASHDPP
jgi:hypothetical protein